MDEKVKKNANINKILENITPMDALKILSSIIGRHSELHDEIVQIANELLCDININDIAFDVRNNLDGIEVEELWERSGSKRYAYVDVSEESWVMFEEALEPFLNEMEKYQKMGLEKESKNYCIGIINGIKDYDANSNSEFKDWAVDAPSEYVDRVFEKWKLAKPLASDIAEVKSVIENYWKNNFTTLVNNPQKLMPQGYLSVEEYEINGKLILHIYIRKFIDIDVMEKYLTQIKIYSDTKPVLVEGDIFKTIIWANEVDEKWNDKTTDKNYYEKINTYGEGEAVFSFWHLGNFGM